MLSSSRPKGEVPHPKSTTRGVGAMVSGGVVVVRGDLGVVVVAGVEAEGRVAVVVLGGAFWLLL